jgi:hypothetical protein
MFHSLLVALLGSQPVIAVADNVPTFNVTPTCRAAAANTPNSFDSCMRDEQSARSTLAEQWSEFRAVDRSACTQETRSFNASYVELLTCLQTARDAAKLERRDKQ